MGSGGFGWVRADSGRVRPGSGGSMFKYVRYNGRIVEQTNVKTLLTNSLLPGPPSSILSSAIIGLQGIAVNDLSPIIRTIYPFCDITLANRLQSILSVT